MLHGDVGVLRLRLWSRRLASALRYPAGKHGWAVPIIRRQFYEKFLLPSKQLPCRLPLALAFGNEDAAQVYSLLDQDLVKIAAKGPFFRNWRQKMEEAGYFFAIPGQKTGTGRLFWLFSPYFQARSVKFVYHLSPLRDGGSRPS